MGRTGGWAWQYRSLRNTSSIAPSTTAPSTISLSNTTAFILGPVVAMSRSSEKDVLTEGEVRCCKLGELLINIVKIMKQVKANLLIII